MKLDQYIVSIDFVKAKGTSYNLNRFLISSFTLPTPIIDRTHFRMNAGFAEKDPEFTFDQKAREMFTYHVVGDNCVDLCH